MFTGKDAKTAIKLLFFTALLGAAFDVCPVFALEKTKGKVNNAPKSEKSATRKPAAKSAAPVSYKVNPGDNLYRISIKHNVALDELMRVNNLKEGDSLRAGMTLKIPSSAKKETAINEKKVLFDWPVKKVTLCVDDGFDGVKPIGVIISAPAGSPVHSSAGGVVEKIGFMRGYGQFVLVKHPYNYFTIYSYLENIIVKKGQAVNKGTVLGCVDADKKSIHFQIDRNGKPVNPFDHLPKKN